MSRRRPVPWTIWLVAWLTAAVLAGDVAQIVAEHRPGPKVETTVRDVHVLPVDQAKLTGTITSLQGADVNAPPIAVPFATDTGSVLVKEAIVDGKPATVAWQGGRPFQLAGSGGIDLGPTTVTINGAGATWPLDGEHGLTFGRYTVDAPVAVGRNGLAAPFDRVTFVADGKTSIETHGGITVTRPVGKLHLTGPGRLVLDGTFTIQTRAGTRQATHVDFGPGSFVVDLDGATITATLQGRLTT